MSFMVHLHTTSKNIHVRFSILPYLRNINITRTRIPTWVGLHDDQTSKHLMLFCCPRRDCCLCSCLADYHGSVLQRLLDCYLAAVGCCIMLQTLATATAALRYLLTCHQQPLPCACPIASQSLLAPVIVAIGFLCLQLLIAEFCTLIATGWCPCRDADCCPYRIASLMQV